MEQIKEQVMDQLMDQICECLLVTVVLPMVRDAVPEQSDHQSLNGPSVVSSCLNQIFNRAEVSSSFITTTVWEESQVTPQGSHR